VWAARGLRGTSGGEVGGAEVRILRTFGRGEGGPRAQGYERRQGDGVARGVNHGVGDRYLPNQASQRSKRSR